MQSLKRLGALVLAGFLGATVLLPVTRVQAQTNPPFELRFPQEATKTTFSNDWGARRSGGRRHKGTDLMAEHKMVEVYAVADGVVAKINERSRPGRYVVITHEGGWDTLYVHLNDDNPGTDDGDAPWYFTVAPGIEEGVSVEAGQLIGWGGDSGNAEDNKPHTHFELHYDGREVNPYSHLVAAYERDLAGELRRADVLANQVFGGVLIV
jgi:murein DD-endopeptidase MepM/ murein hydrolase activator NlpD